MTVRSRRSDLAGVVVTAAAGLTLFALAVTPPHTVPLARLLAGAAPAPLLGYALRFAAATVLLGIVPVVALRVSGGRLHEIGVRRAKRIRPAAVLLACAVAALVGFLSRRNPQLAAFYPFGRPDTLELAAAFPFGLALGLLAVRTGSILPGLLVHAAAGIALDLSIMVAR